MKIELLDSRRLTGPNLFWDRPGAILDIAIERAMAGRLILAWTREAGTMMSALGWSPEHTCSRVFDGGVNLVISAPIDVLYTACELNELAFNRAVANLRGEPTADLNSTIAALGKLAAGERNPRLLAMQAAAARHGVPFLWDDDEVSVGFGKKSMTWPAGQLPEPVSVDWSVIGSVPLAIVTGTNGKSTTVRLSAAILSAAGLRAGITSTDYIRVGDEILERGDFSGPGGARTLLRHPYSEAVVLEVARGGLLRRGVGVEGADAALITNVAADHMGEYGINTVEDMAEAKFIVRRALAKNAPLILNADDPQSVRMAAALNKRITWFGLDANHPVLHKHLESKGQAAYLANGWLVLADGDAARNIVRAEDIPITFGGAARYNISNALGAMALCHALGATDDALAAGLRAFSGDADSNPGRGNLFEKNGIKIFLDFAHNEHGVRAIRDTVRAFDANRRLVLIGQAGDRSDQDIRQLVSAVCGLEPSRLLVCDMPGYERGRQAWAVAEMIRESAIEQGVPAQAIAMFKSPLDGVRQALADARDGDCLVLLAFTQRKEVLATIRSYVAGN